MAAAAYRQSERRAHARASLLLGASATALFGAGVADAQLAAIRAALPNPAAAAAPAAAVRPGAVAPGLTQSMQQVVARQSLYSAQIAAQAGIVASANAAARQAAQAAAAASQVANGLAAGGLKPVDLATQNSSALTVWAGADQPTQATAGGTVTVTVNQTQQRALLSWDSFNVGAGTALTFNQKGNTDWVVVNRVVGGIDPATGLRRPDASPTQILGSIKADGSVFVLNRAGVLFGATSQVNLRSLVASSLELGAKELAIGGSANRILSLTDRNTTYLQTGILPGDQSTLLADVAGETHGDVTVQAGARIASTGGFVILAAPKVASAGEIASAAGGQISLQGGTQIDAFVSSGATASVDPYTRGLVLASVGGGSVDVSGSLAAPQGYVSLGTDAKGSVALSGIVTSTTSVSRNGKVSLTGGTVTIAPKAVIAITPEASADTIPQSADSIAAFKTSQIDIGGRAVQVSQARVSSAVGGLATDLTPANVAIGRGALISAAGGDVNIGGRAGGRLYTDQEIAPVKVSVAADAAINVAGVADYLVDAGRNQLVISPAKRNELRDTPTYRETTTDGSFTLNGATLYLDPRLSGVRADGVAWIGSPLIEAGSLAEQIGVAASELLTRGGNILFRTPQATGNGIAASTVDLAAGATLDFSGGWIRYRDGVIRSSKLISSDGRIVDISQADPNDSYVAVSNGFVETLPQLVQPRVFATAESRAQTFEAGYAEGRDAGSVTIEAPTGTLDAVLHGEAAAGPRQISDAQAASKAATRTGDLRKLQAANGELPAGGMLRVSALLGGDILVGGGGVTRPTGTIRLDDARLSAAGLSGLSLQTSGATTLAAGSNLTLAPGGALAIDAGRTIRFAGTVDAAGGSIAAQTYQIAQGSVFTDADDLYAPGTSFAVNPNLAAGSFDILVDPTAKLSVAGRFVNDLLVTDGFYGGGGYTSGGSIRLTTAPRVTAFTDATQTAAVDLSGSLRVAAGSLLDASGGGYVSPTGRLALDGKGGDVSLINETTYAQLFHQTADPTVANGIGLLFTDLSSFGAPGIPSAILPATISSVVDLAPGTIRSFGFKGGGTFTLVTPDLAFGTSLADAAATRIPLDFLAQTGFATLDLSAWATKLTPGFIAGGSTLPTGLLATTTLRVAAGETLNLTQSIRPSVLDQDAVRAVSALATGGDLGSIAALAPTNALGDFDNLAANLVLGGLTELDNAGTIVGAPGAAITAPRLFNDGTIRIAGGTITQRLELPQAYADDRPAIALHPILGADGVDRGAAFATVFGPAGADGRYNASALVTAAYQSSDGRLTVGDLLTSPGRDRIFYYLGALDAGEGIRLSERSVTDLSGISIRDPRAPTASDGSQIARGRVIAGGTLAAAGLRLANGNLFTADRPLLARSDIFVRIFSANALPVANPVASNPAQRLNAVAGATIDLSGASDTFQYQTGGATYASLPVWSDGGVLSALGGGSINGATIDAHGGAAQAAGGTIEWLNPVLAQGDTVGTNLPVDRILGAGFDRFIARGLLNTAGDVSMTLGRAFLLASPDFTGIAPGENNNIYDVGIGSTGRLAITAPHIAISSVNQRPGTPIGAFTGATPKYAAVLTGTNSFDISGGLSFGFGFDSVTLATQGDLRLIGVEPTTLRFNPAAVFDPSLSGGLVVPGDLTIRAGQVYATTGTGNLQKAGSTVAPVPFLIASIGGFTSSGSVVGKKDAVIRFERASDALPAAPYSAGSYVRVLGGTIEQDGVLRAPLGRIDLGSKSDSLVQAGTLFASGSTKSLTLGQGSVTSVSAEGLTIPYGTTVDLTSFLFTPTVIGALTTPPAPELDLAGGTVTVAPGATVNASGGGALYAYEFTSGTGGSRDVLSRFNSDPYSGNAGFQYADGRQVYALVPAAGASAAALYDPIYSDDYTNLYGADVGRTVTLDPAQDFAGGTYVLMPAKYALLPGALRIVENSGAAAPPPGASSIARDGSIRVGGVFGVSGTSLREGQRRSFTIQPQSSFRQYSTIVQTDAATALSRSAQLAGLVVPVLPRDAARIVIDPATGLTIGSTFDTRAATGGRGSQVDILGNVLNVVATLADAPQTGLNLRVADLGAIGANSLLLGGRRTEQADGTTRVDVTASRITVSNNAANPLTAPEILLAVRGPSSSLTITDGASLQAIGKLDDTSTGAYDLSVTGDVDGRPGRVGTLGGFLRVSSGGQRGVDFDGQLAAGDRDTSSFTVGNATIRGTSASLDSSRDLEITAPTLAVGDLALGSDQISVSTRAFGVRGLIIAPDLEAQLAAIGRVELRSSSAIAFTQGAHSFQNLALDAPGIRLLNETPGRPRDAYTVTINARDLTIGNSRDALASCTSSGPLICGSSGNSLVLNATQIHFTGGTFRTSYGFDKAVALTASAGADYSGAGTLDVGSANLTFTTPWLVDRGTGKVPDGGATPVSLAVNTSGTIAFAAPAGAAVALPTTPLAPGARLLLGALDAPVAGVTVTGTTLRASAGTIDIESTGDIGLSGSAALLARSYAQTFGDATDPVVATADGGTLTLVSRTGGIALGQGTTLGIGGTSGRAGALNLLAAQGAIALGGTIDAAAPGGGASLSFDAGRSAFDLGGFATGIGKAFTGSVAIRSGSGDLALVAGQALRVANLSLTSDGGSVLLGGTVDASGVNGGDVSLFARDRVALAGGALIDVRATGYAADDARQASAGDVILGVGQAGAIDVASGARIELGAGRADARLIPHTQFDPRSNSPVTAYTYVEADKGGTLTLRAPVVNGGVNVGFAGAANGARDVTVEGYRTFQLGNVDQSRFTGVAIANEVATLDAGAVAAGKINFLSGDAPGTIVDFIRTFDIAGSRGRLGSLSGLAVYHERPGVELAYNGGITLASNWNLAAGSVDIAGAVAAGDMQAWGLSTAANPRYQVVAGREADLFQKFTTMLYRVGGRVDGAAGVLTLKAGGTLQLDHSINDGFFNFADQTDPAYLDYALGGGQRDYQPTLQISCGGNDCSDTAAYVADTRKNPQLPAGATSINLVLTAVSRGDEVQLASDAPYNPSANAAAATSGGAGGGDPFGGASMFPLLGDGRAADSFGLRLVGGAGATASANPLHIDRGSGGDVVVQGSSSYSLVASKPTGAYSGPVQLTFNDNVLNGDLFSAFAGQSQIDPETLRTAATRVTFTRASDVAAQYLRAQANAFFAAYPGQVQFIGPANAPTGIAAPFELVAKFLQSTDASGKTLLQRFGDLIATGTTGYDAPQPLRAIDVPGTKATVRSLVRTGTGSIAVAAGGDVDLTNGPATLAGKTGGRAANAERAAQLGGTAIYTAGQAFRPAATSAVVAGTNQRLTIDPADYLAPETSVIDWVPSVTGRLVTDPVYAHNGGSISIEAGSDVLGRRDVWSETFYGNEAQVNAGTRQRSLSTAAIVGTADQRWRVGLLGTTDGQAADTTLASNIRINAQQFSSGIGTLGGGDVSIRAGGSMSEITTALDTTITVGDVGDSFGQMLFGGGSLDVKLGGNLSGGRLDLSTGLANVSVGGSVGPVAALGAKGGLDVRLTDAALTIRAGGTVALDEVSALGVNYRDVDNNAFATPVADANGQGYFLDRGGLTVTSAGTIAIGDDAAPNVNVMPPSLQLTSFAGDIQLSTDEASILYPSAYGQLSLLAGGTLDALAIDLEDSDPSLLPGVLSAFKPVTAVDPPVYLFGRPFGLPSVFPSTSDPTRRLLHNATPTHIADLAPARIAVGGSLDALTLYLSKAARISAGEDITDMIFVGQNLRPDDVTRVVAGRDIVGTSAQTFFDGLPGFQFTSGRQVIKGNLFVLGGPGSLFVEAGRNLGPFLNSATIANFGYAASNEVLPVRGTSDYAGGIIAVGNDYNPWLAPVSADIYAFFGVAGGMNFNALRDYYLDPANVDALPGDLFEQNVDEFGNKTPDRSRPIYRDLVASWMKANQPAALIAAFGTTDVSADQAYKAFAALTALTQRRLLLDSVYFNELAAPSNPAGASYLQYVRGYKAVDLLFPSTLGYTKNDLTGASNGGTRVSTGDLDLRLAAIETTRGSNVTLLGPGGSAVIGSVTRTSAQASARAYQPEIIGEPFAAGSVPFTRPLPTGRSFQLLGVPLGAEGVLTLRGGTIHGFTDGDLRLNQSRLFSQQSGDITLWSSNGDLNAGQGPKSAANVPPIIVRFNPSGGSEVDAAGGVVGAGIAGFAGLSRSTGTGGFQLIDITNDPDAPAALAQLSALDRGATVTIAGKTYRRELPTITLVAPAGTVDAGDAGVRASGDIFVAAARVANADNFKVGGTSVGIPTLNTATAPVLPSAAASSLAANVFRTTPTGTGDQRSIITVDLLGYFNGDDQDCKDAQGKPLDNCPAPQTSGGM